jgi:branched-chain amino acid transport system substrate-binding protein
MSKFCISIRLRLLFIALIISVFIQVFILQVQANEIVTPYNNSSEDIYNLGDKHNYELKFQIEPREKNLSDKLKFNFENKKQVKVALLLPLTGIFAKEGNSILNGSQLAFFDLAPEDFILMPIDTRGTAEGALEAVKKASNEGVKLIIGPLLSEEVSAITPIARSKNINIIAFSNNPVVAGSGVFLIGHTPRQQVNRIVDYAISLGHKKFGALLPDSNYGHTVLRHFRNSLISYKAELSRIQFYNVDGSNAEEAVRRISDYDNRRDALVRKRKLLDKKNDEISLKALSQLKTLHTLGEVEFDALLLTDEPDRLRQIVPLIPYYEIDPSAVQFLGLELWNDPLLMSEPALIGGLYTAPTPEAEENFIIRYKAAYNYKPLAVAALAYDATALAAVLTRNNYKTNFSEKELTTSRGFFGASGVFRFLKSGFSERGFAVLKVSSGSISDIVDMPPRKFKP